jgi:hypothetical protein
LLLLVGVAASVKLAVAAVQVDIKQVLRLQFQQVSRTP